MSRKFHRNLILHGSRNDRRTKRGFQRGSLGSGNHNLQTFYRKVFVLRAKRLSNDGENLTREFHTAKYLAWKCIGFVKEITKNKSIGKNRQKPGGFKKPWFFPRNWLGKRNGFQNSFWAGKICRGNFLRRRRSSSCLVACLRKEDYFNWAC